jgi:SPP1 gp7 family putative phage head morphogenesis protein
MIPAAETTRAFRTPLLGRRARKRPKKPLRPMREPRAEALRYTAVLRRVVADAALLVRERLVPKLPALLAEADRMAPTTRTDDAGDTLARILESILLALGLSDERARRIAIEMLERVQRRHASEFVRLYESSLAVNPLAGAEPWLREQMGLAVRENAVLIKSLPEQMLSQIEGVVQRGMLAGTRHEELAKLLVERLGVAESRAVLIARDQTLKWHGSLQRLRQLDAGVTEFTWSTSNDERVRPAHRVRDGKRYKWTSSPTPGQEVNCLPGESHVSVPGEVRKAYRRPFQGRLTVLRTESGVTVRCTPNHPVLTRRGWIAAQDVEVGEDVWEAQKRDLPLLEADVEGVKPTIEQVFRALSVIGVVHAVTTVGGDFHGDAAVDQQVDVVTADWSLPLHGETSRLQDLCKLFLERAAVCLPVMPGERDLFAGFLGMGLPPYGSVRGFCKALAFLRAGAAHAHEHRAALAAWLDTPALEFVANGLARDPQALVDGLRTLASQVRRNEGIAVDLFRVVRFAVHDAAQISSNTPTAERLAEAVRADSKRLGDGSDTPVKPQQLLGAIEELRSEPVASICDDSARSEVRAEAASIDAKLLSDEANVVQLAKKPLRVVEKFSTEFSGHVYNLETSQGWYTTQGIAVHNCRCAAIPVIPDFEDEE